MTLAKITGQGLAAIAIVVAALWTCIIGERVLVAHANASAAETLVAMRALRSRSQRQPAANPAQRQRGRVRPRLG